MRAAVGIILNVQIFTMRRLARSRLSGSILVDDPDGLERRLPSLLIADVCVDDGALERLVYDALAEDVQAC
jgi:hypothetical protein